MSKRFLISTLLICTWVQSGCAAGVDQNKNAGAAHPAKASEVSFEPFAATDTQSKIEKQAVSKLQSKHYNHKNLDDSFSKHLFSAYVDALDGGHDVLLQTDVAVLRKRYGTELDEQLKQGETTALYAVFNRYQKRRLQINQFALDTVQNDFASLDTGSDRSLRIDRDQVPRPIGRDGRRMLWRKKLVNEIIRERLNGTKGDQIQADLEQRYQNKIRRLGQVKARDAFSAYMHAVTHSYDPHTDYFSPERSKNFDIDMNLELQGIGAELRNKNGYAELVRLVPGGPAAKSGELQPTDRIMAVGQGKNGDLTSVIGMRLDHTVELIRGKAGSVVRLRVSAADTSQTQVLSLTRAKIELKDQAAQHRVIDLDYRGQDEKVGLITLPSFYNGTAADVKEALGKLKKADVNGVVLDLRNNGGGALGEAMKLIGLLMPPAPGVQIKSAGGQVQALGDRSRDVAYGGPLVVLVNRLSASASEIAAAALQDYGRAVVVGSQTFGKGTVQTILPLKAGELKLTEAKFYRVTGDSTQLRGVTPDVQFPSAINPDQIGESALDNALPWDRIPPTRYPHSNALDSVLSSLRAKHETRADKKPDFHYLEQRIRLARERGSRSEVSLNLAKRRQRKTELQQAQLALANEHRQALGKKPYDDYDTLKAENDNSSNINKVNTDRASDDNEVNAFETEAGRIVLDLKRLLIDKSDKPAAT